mmetsp:Transcript_22653/g.56690  ORF Transcript_22653/g.56690 Transcript_22653/m.56690 type:complete len:293 (+) Transcript_22653:19-897(+)
MQGGSNTMPLPGDFSENAPSNPPGRPAPALPTDVGLQLLSMPWTLLQQQKPPVQVGEMLHGGLPQAMGGGEGCAPQMPGLPAFAGGGQGAPGNLQNSAQALPFHHPDIQGLFPLAGGLRPQQGGGGVMPGVPVPLWNNLQAQQALGLGLGRGGQDGASSFEAQSQHLRNSLMSSMGGFAATQALAASSMLAAQPKLDVSSLKDSEISTAIERLNKRRRQNRESQQRFRDRQKKALRAQQAGVADKKSAGSPGKGKHGKASSAPGPNAKGGDTVPPLAAAAAGADSTERSEPE